MSGPDCVLFGHSPKEVASPQTVVEAQQRVADAAGRAIAPWGGGTRQALGYPPERYDIALSTARLDQITDYQPADLTITAQAGVTVAQLQRTLAAQGQFLPLDVALPERQTIGGIIAARADSLRRFAFGSVRDSLIGLTVINARAELIRGGGKVVKNVAGYDLPKMYCGSLGTLGLIVEATFKVAPLPERSATVAFALEAERNSEDVLDELLGSDLQPSFLSLLNPAAAQELVASESSEPGKPSLVLGFDGSDEAIAWQLKTIDRPEYGANAAEGIALRDRLRDFALRPALMTASFHILSSQGGAFTRMIEWTAGRTGFAASIVADAAVGIISAHFAPEREDADWRVFHHDLKDKADRVGGSCIVERMPDILRQADAPVWSPILGDFALMARLKEMLDPSRIWNPGRFIGRL